MSFWPFFSTSYDHHCLFVVVECVLWCQLQFGSNESIKFNSNENDTRPNCTTKEMYGTEPKVKKKKQADKTKKNSRKVTHCIFCFSFLSLSLSLSTIRNDVFSYYLSIHIGISQSLIYLSAFVCVCVNSHFISFLNFSVLCLFLVHIKNDCYFNEWKEKNGESNSAR